MNLWQQQQKKKKKKREAKDWVGKEEEEHSSQIWLLLYRLSSINRKRNLFLLSNFSTCFVIFKKTTLYSCIYLSSFSNKSWDLPNKGQLFLKSHYDIKDEKFDICPINLVRDL